MRLAIITLAASLAFAQSSAPAPPRTPAATAPAFAFEVASIRPHPPPLRVIMGFSSSGPRLQLEGYTLYHLLMEAYSVRSYQIHFVHRDERASVFYDIVANAPEGSPTRDQFRLMLQALLADRFQVKAHFEKQKIPVYALVIAKGGPKLEKGTPDGHGHVGVNGRNQFLETSNITMTDLAASLNLNTLVTDRPVVDRTGLSGSYKLRIEATPQPRMAANPQDGDLSIFTAVQEQLGLKLEASTAMTDILVVDSFQPPTEN